jgi:hypothetical protein
VKKVVTVQSLDISTLLAEHFSQKEVSFLSIDVEGPDFEILERIDLDAFPFDVIQIEPSNHIHRHSIERITNYLFLRGYRLVALTEVNSVFSRNQEASIRGSFVSLPFSAHRLSFDVFDTLIARRFGDPKTVVRNFCAKYGIDYDRRISADDGTRSLEEIYLEADIPLEHMEHELEEELENLIPIKQNQTKVRPGDILVSDMYLSKNQLRTLLKEFGLEKNELYVSNSDKATGKYWRELPPAEAPLLHFGDNPISDYTKALEAGVGAVLCNQADMTQHELRVMKHNDHLAWLLRELRLAHMDSNSNVIERIAYSMNVTLLFAYCEILFQKKRNLVFLGRDCFKLSEVYRTFFGPCEYMQFSRNILGDLDLAAQKLRSARAEDPLFVDLVSTGTTWAMLQDEFEATVLIRIMDYSWGDAELSTKNLSSVFSSYDVKHSIVLELLNPAQEGVLLSIDPETLAPKSFGKHEMHETVKQVLLDASKHTLDKARHYKNIAGRINNPRELALTALEEIWESDEGLRAQFFSSIQAEEENLKRLTGD